MKSFKPLLGKNLDNLDEIEYPVYVSTKLDGIRCIFKEGQMLSRSLKPIPNKQLQDKFQHLKDLSKKHNVILDGELYDHYLPFQLITSLCMTKDFMDPKKIKSLNKDLTREYTNEFTEKDKEQSKLLLSFYKDDKFINPLEFYCFDLLQVGFEDEMFEYRSSRYESMEEYAMIPVPQHMARTKENLESLFNSFLDENFEGAIIRDPNSKYKFGRSTLKEGALLKMKPFKTFDAQILDVEERLENTNESFKNELGHSTKRNTKENKAHTGIGACFVVKWGDDELKVTLTGPECFRKQVFEHREEYIDKWIEFKAMTVGMKDLPRHPTYLRMRQDRD